MRNLRRVTSVLLVGVVSAVLGLAAQQPANAVGRTFTIVNYGSGKCLEADPLDNYYANGDRIRQNACNGQPEQSWSSESAGNGYYHLVNQRSFMCMDIRDGSASSGTAVQQWTCTNTKGMNWKPQVIDPFGGGKRVVSEIFDGQVLCLDVEGGSLEDHAPIQSYRCTSNNFAQIFSFQ